MKAAEEKFLELPDPAVKGYDELNHLFLDIVYDTK
jgi:hypothetical protein